MTSLGLSNKYIENFLYSKSKSFKGVYSCNSLPVLTGNFTIISNLSKVNEPGTHFIVIVVNDNQIGYFDPLGLPCFNKYILKYMSKFKKKHVYNKIQFQCWNSIFCGYYCILFILLHDRNYPFSKLKLLFSKNCQQNDKKVVELIKYLINENIVA